MYECRIAETLAELRNSKGVTQEEVAQSLSVSNKTVSKWENGASTPDLSMVVELARYYGVTTDTLLGLSVQKKQSTAEEIGTLFEGLDRRGAVRKAFETARALVPAMYDTVVKECDALCEQEESFPTDDSRFYRSAISLHELFAFSASSENVNVAVMLLRNRANFAWMNDATCQKEIVKLFKLLSHEDVLSVLYFIHSVNCSESFTADYVADHMGLCAERVAEILNALCSVGACHWVTAHLVEGAVRVYECHGDGLILSVVALAFEKMCGKEKYDYNFDGGCKMIGGERE